MVLLKWPYLSYLLQIQNIFRAINIVMDSVILSQLNNLEKEIDSEVIKTKRGRKKKTDAKTLPKINEKDTNDIREKRDRLTVCVLSGNSKQYLGKEYTEQQIKEMDSNYINILSNCSRPCYLFKPSYLGSFAAFAPRHLGLSQGNLVQHEKEQLKFSPFFQQFV